MGRDAERALIWMLHIARRCSASFGDTLLDVSNDEPRGDDGDNGDHQEHDRGLHCARTTVAGAPDTS
jgi:hypothetical protein